MAPKPDIVYSKCRSKSVVPYHRMIGNSNDERDSEYVPPGMRTLTPSTRDTRGTPQKVAFSIVSASQSDEKSTLTAHRLGLPRVLMERLVPKRLQVQIQPTLQGRMRPRPSVLDHLETLTQRCLPAMLRLMRPIFQSLLQHPRMLSLHRFLMIPTGGASMVYIRSTGMPRC